MRRTASSRLHDLKRKDGGSQRRAEDGRERTRHAAHRHQAAVVVFRCSALPISCPDTLPPSSSAAPSRPLEPADRWVMTVEANQRCGAQGQGLMLPHGHKDLVVEPPPSGSKDARYRNTMTRARPRQQTQQPRLCGARMALAQFRASPNAAPAA